MVQIVKYKETKSSKITRNLISVCCLLSLVYSFLGSPISIVSSLLFIVSLVALRRNYDVGVYTEEYYEQASDLMDITVKYAILMVENEALKREISELNGFKDADQ